MSTTYVIQTNIDFKIQIKKSSNAKEITHDCNQTHKRKTNPSKLKPTYTSLYIVKT